MRRIIPTTFKPVYSHTKNVGDLLQSFAKERDSKSPICIGSSRIDHQVIRILTESLNPEGRYLVLLYYIYTMCVT